MILVRYSHLKMPLLPPLVMGPKIHHWTFDCYRIEIFQFSRFFGVFFGREKTLASLDQYLMR